MREHNGGVAAWLAVAVLSACLLQLAYNVMEVESATILGFYANSCPTAETLVRQEVQRRFGSDPTVTAGLLRMFFHDCFVQGCDASLLIDSTPGNTAEKESGPNLTVRDFDLIDTIKTRLEATCPGVVSCADIIALATRDSVALAGGPSYAVRTGRFDGRRSRSTDANILPSPASTVDQARSAFASQGLSLNDMVILLGAHTTGFARCGFFSDRLYDFQGSGQSDPTMNPTLVNRLKGVCPNPASGNPADPTVALDQGTRDTFDSSYYSQLRSRNGILQIDQELNEDSRTAPLVVQFTNPSNFFPAFINSITTLGDLNLKTAATGEVRLNCHRVNPPGTPPPRPPPPPPPITPPPPPPVATPPPLRPPPPPPLVVSPPPPPPLVVTPPPPPPTTPNPPPITPPPPPTRVTPPPPVTPNPPPITPTSPPPPPPPITPNPPPITPTSPPPPPVARPPPPPPISSPPPPPPLTRTPPPPPPVTPTSPPVVSPPPPPPLTRTPPPPPPVTPSPNAPPPPPPFTPSPRPPPPTSPPITPSTPPTPKPPPVTPPPKPPTSPPPRPPTLPRPRPPTMPPPKPPRRPPRRPRHPPPRRPPPKFRPPPKRRPPPRRRPPPKSRKPSRPHFIPIFVPFH